MEKGIARHSMIKTALVAFFLCALIVPAGADSTRGNESYSSKSANGLFKIDFVPKSSEGDAGEGKIYDLSHGGERLLYTVPWFAWNVALSNDGHTLVRFGPLASDITGARDLAIHFYYDGKPRKSYKVRDLLKDVTSVDRLNSHYIWRTQQCSTATGFSPNGKKYTIVLTDQTVYEFSTIDGGIISTRQDTTVKTPIDIWHGDNTKSKSIADAYLAKEAQLQLLLASFRITEQEAKFIPHSYIWRANLTPINPELSRTEVEVVFAIDLKLDRVQVGLTPQQLEGALTEIKAVPFVQKLLAQDSRNGVRLRAAGDNLHWDSEEVARIIKAFPADLRTAPLKDWVYFIIDSREGCIAIYHPLHKDLFILDSNPANFSQWKKRGEELKMAWKSDVDQYGILSCKGELVSAFAVTRESLK